MYARQRCIIGHVYPNGFHCNIGSSELILPPFSRCAFSTRRDDPDMRQCNTVEELVQVAYDHLDTISPRVIAAFWSLLVKHVQNHRGGNSRAQLNEQFTEILCNTMENMHNFNGRDIATIAISLAKIMKQVESRGQRADTGSLHRNLHNLLIGEVNSENKHYIFSQISMHAIPILYTFDARHLSNLIYSFGLAEYIPKVEDGGTILDVLALEAMSKLHHFNAQDLSNMLWSYAKMESSNSVLFKAAGDSIVGMNDVGEFWPQSLSNIIWAYATSGEPHSQLYEKLGDHVVAMNDLNRFLPQDFSNIIWAYATARETHPQLFKRFGDHIAGMKDLGQFKPQGLSNIIWSYATAGESHSQLFSKVSDHIASLDDLGQFNPQDLSNIIWAYATSGEAHPKLYRKLGDHIVAMKNMGQFKPQALSNIIWSYATAGELHPQLYRKFGDHIVAMKDLNRFVPQDFSNIIWAFATAGESQPQLFSKFANHIIAMKDLGQFKPQELSNFLWAYATVGIIDQHLFTSFAPAVKVVMGHCSSQDLTIIAWAYAVANVNDHSIFNADFMNALQAKANDFGWKDLRQLHQWQLWQDELKSGINLPPALCEKCRQVFVSESCQSSRLQDDVVSVLSSIGLHPKEEVLTPCGYRLDALVEVNGMKVGIEVDGPSHFINREATGSTLIKRRQVSTLDDIRIVSVPYWEWNKLGKDSVKKQQYLRSKCRS